MEKIWALIIDGLVVNCIIASEIDAKDSQYTWVDITNLDPRPSPQWTYDGTNFSAPI